MILHTVFSGLRAYKNMNAHGKCRATLLANEYNLQGWEGDNLTSVK